MDRAEYEKLDQAEDRMWWFAALHRNLLILARRLQLESIDLPLLDAGCGTGGFLTRLAESYHDRVLFGLDLDAEACARAATKSARPVCAASLNNLPFADGALAAIFSVDVLCHRAVDERRALQQIHRCLAEGGWLIVNLPAYRWLLSRHDVAVSNSRRYTVSSLRKLLHAAGFRLVYVSYWNAILLPLMVITRKLVPGARSAVSDVKLYPRPIELLCHAMTLIETALLNWGIRLPFGGSILAIAAKKGVAHD
jgi:SAM-dependent methyltransferase